MKNTSTQQKPALSAERCFVFRAVGARMFTKGGNTTLIICSALDVGLTITITQKRGSNLCSFLISGGGV